MKYRKLGRTGLEISEIGMGLEHLLDKEESVIIETINAAVKGGVTYLDCHPGHDFQQDSVTYEGYMKLGKALEGLRDKLCISYIAHSVLSPEEIEPRFENYLRALKTDHTDVFIVQFCDKVKDYEWVTGNGGLLALAQKLRADGKVRYIGISTHSSDIACRAIDSGAFDVLMYPVNPAFDVLVDEEKYISDDLGKLWDAAYDYMADNAKDVRLIRKNVYTECVKNNIGLVAMKPFGGGFIFGVEKDAGFTPLNLVSYVLAQNGVSTVVPGCTNPQEIKEILTYYTCTDDALDFSKAVLNSRWKIKGNCQYCNHCLPCTAGINIAEVNRAIDNKTASTYNSVKIKASSCVKCGECEKKCPFEVKVIEKMESAVKLFE